MIRLFKGIFIMLRQSSSTEIDLKNHVKIWFSKDCDVFLPSICKRRIAEILKQHPENKVCLVVDKSLLSEKGKKESDDFFEIYSSRIEIIDLDELTPQLDEIELQLYFLVKAELTHPFGNVAAASDMVRWFKPVLEKGCYADFDITFTHGSYVVNCCVPGDIENAVLAMTEHLKKYPQLKLTLVYHGNINSNSDLEILRDFQRNNKAQVSLLDYRYCTNQMQDMKYYSVELLMYKLRQDFTAEDAQLLTDCFRDNPELVKTGLVVNMMEPFPVIEDRIIRDVDFILPIYIDSSHTRPTRSANNVIGFSDIHHPLIKKVQEGILASYQSNKDGNIIFSIDFLEEKYAHIQFDTIFEFRKYLLQVRDDEAYEMDIMLRSGNVTDPLIEYLSSIKDNVDVDKHNISLRVATHILYERSWLNHLPTVDPVPGVILNSTFTSIINRYSSTSPLKSLLFFNTDRSQFIKGLRRLSSKSEIKKADIEEAIKKDKYAERRLKLFNGDLSQANQTCTDSIITRLSATFLV